MSRIEALSLAIARHHGEPPSDPPYCAGITWASPFYGSSYVRGTEPNPKYEWAPRQITEPEIAMWLLKELLAKFPQISLFRELFIESNLQPNFFVTVQESKHRGKTGEGDALELAIGEAFAKSVGLEVE